MLPKFKKSGDKVNQFIMDYFQAVIQGHDPLFNKEKKQVREGDKFNLIREDGTEDPLDFKKISTDLKFDLSEKDYYSFDEIIEKMNDAAIDFAKQTSDIGREAIEQAAENVGNVVKGEMDVENFFKILEMPLIPFDEDGKFNERFIIGGDKAIEKIQKIIAQIESDPELSKRYDDLMYRKRKEWYDRESNRKLVD